MNIGALLGPIVPGDKPSALADSVKDYRDAGFQSLWTAQAIGRGHMQVDPLQALTIAATHAQDLEVGSAILQVPLYNPYELAYRILSLKQVCGDRLTLGVGAGSTEEDFKIFGLDHSQRFTTFKKSMQIIRELLVTGAWQQGDFCAWPETLGHQRLFFGTWGGGVEEAATDYDGWIASGLYRSPEELKVAYQRYQVAGGGRAIVSTILVEPGADLGILKARLDQYAAIGFDDAVVMRLPGAPAAREIVQLVNS